ncbi:MAG: hypothetical protein LQ351_003637 [Letrouitia transgressa]|nr:MAG: hypothetical protein LQ351_003637 [Letrouitia transgressa]
MFLLSLVFEDWAVYELVQSPRRRRLAILLVTSSPSSFLTFGLGVLTTGAIAIAVDTSFYHRTSPHSLLYLLRHEPIVTPLNSLLYNTSTSNLSLHGLHPPYQHLIASLPLLLGPALLLLPSSSKTSLPMISALSATILLSFIPHQEPRFLLPVVPLILSSLQLPRSRRLRRVWVANWIAFNAALGILMGVYHQGGVVPAQIWIGQQQGLGVRDVFWWKTYSPPVWLLGGNETAMGTAIATRDLMGMDMDSMAGRVMDSVGQCVDGQSDSLEEGGSQYGGLHANVLEHIQYS